MNYLISTVNREPGSEFCREETTHLFLQAEELVLDSARLIEEFYDRTDRRQPLALIRHCFMYVLKEDFYWTFREIGEVFGCSHCTPVYAHKKVQDMLSVNDRIVVHYVTKLSLNYGKNPQEPAPQYIPCLCGETQRAQIQ